MPTQPADRELTDAQIHDLAYQDWLGLLDQLWLAIGKQPDEARLRVYARSLSRVPLGLLEPAIERLLQEHTYNTVPTLGEIWGAVRRELGDPRDLAATIESWLSAHSLDRALIRFEAVAVETREPA